MATPAYTINVTLPASHSSSHNPPLSRSSSVSIAVPISPLPTTPLLPATIPILSPSNSFILPTSPSHPSLPRSPSNTSSFSHALPAHIPVFARNASSVTLPPMTALSMKRAGTSNSSNGSVIVSSPLVLSPSVSFSSVTQQSQLQQSPQQQPTLARFIDRQQEELTASLSALMNQSFIIPLIPSAIDDSPEFLNSKQYYRTMQRREKRKRSKRIVRVKHLSRQLHAARRVRGEGGRFMQTRTNNSNNNNNNSTTTTNNNNSNNINSNNPIPLSNTTIINPKPVGIGPGRLPLTPISILPSMVVPATPIAATPIARPSSGLMMSNNNSAGGQRTPVIATPINVIGTPTISTPVAITATRYDFSRKS